jgi:acetyl esterase/lipase
MSDVYWDRMVALTATLQEEGSAGGDAELIARLTLPRAGEPGYTKLPADVRDLMVAARGRNVPVRVYRPRVPGEERPLLIWCHGGAFVGGDLDMPEADAVAREITRRADAVVISVDYRLCVGGVHFPAPSDDLKTVYDWAVRHARQFGVDAEWISIGGASAGACLTAGTALRIRDAGGVQPVSVVLAYPVVHPVLPAPSDELAEKLAGLNPAMSFAPIIFEPVMENYLGAPVAEAGGYAFAGVAADLSGLPATLIINCEYDGLRASGERYEEQLRDAGVDVEQHLARDVAHGHLNRPGLPEAQKSLATIADWVGNRAPGVGL